jgi:spermidine synthase
MLHEPQDFSDFLMPLAILSCVLFLSGIGALIFETLWLRLSGLAFGNSVWSAALILSSFMTGLALGNVSAASSRLRRWRPLRLYALLELAVGLLGCMIVFGLPWLGTWLRPLFQVLWNQQPVLLGARFVACFLLLVLPTTAMGLTLPVLIEDPLLRNTDFGRTIGALYGFNTLGAVVGAVIGEAYLVKAFGLLGTSVAAAMASCLAAAMALLLAMIHTTPAQLNAKQPLLLLRTTYRMPWRLLLVSCATGGILLCLEVVWFRFLRLYVASSSTAFSVMLAVVLAGIGLGGVASAAIHRRIAGSNLVLPVLLLLAGIATLLSYEFFPGAKVQAGAGPFYFAEWPQVTLLSLALMFPIAFLSGTIFPFIVARVQNRLENRRNSTGLATLFNTIGAALGPLVASFVLLPAIGFQWSLVLCAASYVLAGVFITDRGNWSLKRPLGIATLALCAAFVLAIVLFPYQREHKHFEHAALPYEVDDQGHFIARVVKKVEGTSDTYQLLRRDLFGQPYYYRLLTNGFSMSATRPRSQRYMRLFAYLPLALRPQSEDVLLICYGCGVTADAFLHGAQVKRMDVVDISREVLGLADFYSGIEYSSPLRDPRVHSAIQDGRFFLQASPRRYDVISGEPPPPKVAGSVNLYTQEFFSLMNSRLKEDGIATFWLPIDQLKIDEAKAILRAFHNAFSNASVWGSADENWIMVGIKGSGRRVKPEDIQQLWANASSGADLKRIGVEVPQELAALFLMDSDEIDRITVATPPLTDFYPKRLSDSAWDEQASHRFAADYIAAPAALHRFSQSAIADRIWPETLRKSLDSYFVVREARYLSDTIGSNKFAELDLYLRHSHLRTPVLEVLHSDELRVEIAERVARGMETPPTETLPDLMAGALARRDFNAAAALLEKQKQVGAFGADDLFLLAYVYCLNGQVEKAEALVTENIGSIKKDWFVDWLWGKLQAEFGFRPPA